MEESPDAKPANSLWGKTCLRYNTNTNYQQSAYMRWQNCSTVKDYYRSCSEVGLTKNEDHDSQRDAEMEGSNFKIKQLHILTY